MEFGWSGIFQHLYNWDSEGTNFCQVLTSTKGSLGRKAVFCYLSTCMHLSLPHPQSSLRTVDTAYCTKWNIGLLFKFESKLRIKTKSSCSLTLDLSAGLRSYCWNGGGYATFTVLLLGCAAAVHAMSRKFWCTGKTNFQKASWSLSLTQEVQPDVQLGGETGPPCCRSLLLLQPLRLD